MREVGDFVLVGGIGAGKSLGIIIRCSGVPNYYDVLIPGGFVTLKTEEDLEDPPVQCSKVLALMAHWALRDLNGMTKTDYLHQLTMLAEEELNG